MRININPFTLYAKIEALEKKISTFSSSNEKYRAVRGELDETLDALTRLKTTSLVSEQLKNTVVKLYGDLESNLVERELSKLEARTRSLMEGRVSDRAIKQLEGHIQKIRDNHLTLREDRHIIKAAEEALIQARSKKKAPQDLSITNSQASKQTSHRDADPLEAFDLLEIAKLLYDGNIRQAKKQFLELPEEHKERFEKLIGSLPATAFEDALPTIQALMATANEIVGNGEGYPGPNEIDHYFLGLQSESPNPITSKMIRIDFN